MLFFQGSTKVISMIMCSAVLAWFTVSYAGILRVRSTGWPGTTLEGTPCRYFSSSRSGSNKSFDYRNRDEATRKQLNTVERYHFTLQVEQLIGGESTTDIGRDIHYTLRYFPNHYRALNSMMKYQMLNNERTNNSIPPMECFLERATVFVPDDSNVQLIYGMFFHRKGLLDKAIEKYRIAKKLRPNSAEVYYNMGLAFIDMGKNDEALQHAKKAYALGYPLPGLRKKLQELGIWKQ